MTRWLLTTTYYGTWLPGDKRGSVTSVRDQRRSDSPSLTRREHSKPGESYEQHLPLLERAASEQLRGPPIYFDREMATIVFEQFQETVAFRRWLNHAVAIMRNHLHIVLEAGDDVLGQKILADLKAYASRRLNTHIGKPLSGTWWTSNGSHRKLRDELAFESAHNYVVNRQEFPLLIWDGRKLEYGRVSQGSE
ncbi:hypothetical protein NA78x_000808 [Anatilimnocola sp. NA78]|uniref:hypothetical protein n=1 Tax=Anatilimnocola sp. NA78 TaxID=3415683 RepID=UPI003CE554CC